MQFNKPTSTKIKTKIMTTLRLKSTGRSPSRLALLLIPLALACFALSPMAQAACLDGCNNALFNVFQGDDALISNITGSGNSAFGWRSLFSNIDGSFNTAVGGGALVLNNGDSNTAVGAAALLLNTFGVQNTAVGSSALLNSDGSVSNTAVGFATGQNLVFGTSNSYIGHSVGFTVPDESDTIRIGDKSNGNGYGGSLDCYIGGIFNNFQPVSDTVVQVTLNLADDHLGWDNGPNNGSAPMSPSDPQRQAMLNDKVEKLLATVARQQKQIDALTAGLQKVSAQFELNKLAPRTVRNND
jgi:hypothetical protein